MVVRAVLRFGISLEDLELYSHAHPKCDLCGKVFWTNYGHSMRIDHDHGHCTNGCPDCVRGFLCSTCNMVEGMIAKAVRMGMIVTVDGRLGAYYADPPFQRWRRERALENGRST